MTVRQRLQRSLSTVARERSLQRETTPRFSIILCTYNRRNFVLSTLASLRRQTLPYNLFEVIVVDNGSQDDTLNSVRSYVSAGEQQDRRPEDIWQVQCLSEPLNGLANARNTGLIAASGEIAVFLDDDTIADPRFLEQLLASYEETGADAIGGRVEIRFEAPRPHWLSDELLELLGHFAPSSQRLQLKEPVSFSSCSFSVKIEAFQQIGYFSPLLSKRLHHPASMEIQDICRRLYRAGCTLWYEPEAVVIHRASAPRLQRPFFVGRAYWQGRSEVLGLYADTLEAGDKSVRFSSSTLQAIFAELHEVISLAFLHRPLLKLAGKSTNERLLAAMAQARSWGHLQQRLQFIEHVPANVTAPAVLLVHAAKPDPTVDLLRKAFTVQEVSYTASVNEIPLEWLWRHRAYQKQAAGIIHFYRPGAFELTSQQRQKLWFRLWLAQQWGIRVVTTDSGGWWQSASNWGSLNHRVLERRLFRQSDIILAYTRQPDQLYPDKKIRRRVRALPHPGFRGYFAQPLERSIASQQLGLAPASTHNFVYLCLAEAYTERELVYLLDTFTEVCKIEQEQQSSGAACQRTSQLLLVGSPSDKQISTRIFKLAALNSAIHLTSGQLTEEDIPLYMGAIDALVIPHFAAQTAGVLESALLALSYGRIVIVPNLPRFRGMLPPDASLLYDAGSKEALKEAILRAKTLDYQQSEVEAATFNAESGWNQYARRLLKIYQQLLRPESDR